MDALLNLLAGPWTTYLLWILRQNGSLRFGELKRQLQGISSRVLTLRLRMLEEAGVIYRNHRPTIPPEVSYGLTERGEELGNVLDELEVIARRWGLVSEAEPPDKVGSPV
ncbi:MAG: transcriptional regulator [Deltaproteobacteria bacterium]|nr:MAG: transcriptional regulator [Deltaproteobacteria bacterium]